MFKLIGAVANLDEIEDVVAEEFEAEHERCGSGSGAWKKAVSRAGPSSS